MKIKNNIFLIALFSITSLIAYSCMDDVNKKTSSEKNEKRVEKEITGKVNFLQRGKEIAGQTQKVLGGTLKKKLSEGGVPLAIDYCNIKAIPLTDSLSKVYKAKIRRASHKPRNPGNKANEMEMNVISKYLLSSHSMEPVIQEKGEKVYFFAPIITKPLCLNCHGEIGKTLNKDNYELIKARYPEDKATGFKEGELRGIWSIQFNKNSSI